MEQPGRLSALHCAEQLRDGTWLTRGHTAVQREGLSLGSDSQASTHFALQSIIRAGSFLSVLEPAGRCPLLTMAARGLSAFGRQLGALEKSR